MSILQQFHKQPTFDEKIIDLHKQTLPLPDRRATTLRNFNKLTVFDDINESMAKEKELIEDEKKKSVLSTIVKPSIQEIETAPQANVQFGGSSASSGIHSLIPSTRVPESRVPESRGDITTIPEEEGGVTTRQQQLLEMQKYGLTPQEVEESDTFDFEATLPEHSYVEMYQPGPITVRTMKIILTRVRDLLTINERALLMKMLKLPNNRVESTLGKEMFSFLKRKTAQYKKPEYEDTINPFIREVDASI
jgi:hypothetical protein